MHSTASDGLLPPGKVVEAAARTGLAAIALTDHDSVGGIEAAKFAAAAHGIDFVVGVELSASENGRETHILGLHLEDLGYLEGKLRGFREARLRRAARMVEKLRGFGFSITMDMVVAAAGDGAVGRPHIAKTLVEIGALPDSRAAFDNYIGAGRPAYIPKEVLSATDAIGIIHSAGGLAIVAHPGAEGTLEYLSMLRNCGMDGAEVLHPSHSMEDMVRIDTLVGELGMVRSGGSDWHGADVGRRRLGNQDVPIAWLQAQRERVHELRVRRAG
jgi:predicted metal-dependent phosphoesterase TrpH